MLVLGKIFIAGSDPLKDALVTISVTNEKSRRVVAQKKLEVNGRPGPWGLPFSLEVTYYRWDKLVLTVQVEEDGKVKYVDNVATHLINDKKARPTVVVEPV